MKLKFDPYPKRPTKERLDLVLESKRYDGQLDNARELWAKHTEQLIPGYDLYLESLDGNTVAWPSSLDISELDKAVDESIEQMFPQLPWPKRIVKWFDDKWGDFTHVAGW